MNGLAPIIDGDARGVNREPKPPPGGSTDNHLLMHGIRRLFDTCHPEAVPLWTVVAIRCHGKDHCWPSVDTLMADVGGGVSRRTLINWRAALVNAGLIRIQRRRNRSAVLWLESGSATGCTSRSATGCTTEGSKGMVGLPPASGEIPPDSESITGRLWRGAMLGDAPARLVPAAQPAGKP